MQSKKFTNRESILERLKNKDALIEKYSQSDIDEMIQELDIYQAEILAQNEELVEKEFALSNLNIEYLSLFDDAPIIYIIIDKKLNIVNSNNLAKKTFKILNSTRSKKSLLLLVPKNDIKILLDWISIEAYTYSDLELLLISSQGKKKFKIIGSEHKINKDQIILSVINIQKESELFEELNNLNSLLEEKIKKEVEKNRQNDKKLQEQSKFTQMGEMINMIAHQWRQPLNAISLTSNNLLFKCMVDNIEKELFKQELDLINQYSQILSQTIDDFRDFFKVDKNKQEHSLTDIVKKSLDIVNLSISSKNIDIISEFKDDKKLFLYQNELMQVIINILKNAQDKFFSLNQEEKKIKIKTYKKQNKHIIAIEDNGAHIPKEVLPKIFDPYFSTKEDKNGTGLGLYMSKVIVEEHHNGELKVENNNTGVCFKVIIPSENK